MNMTNIRKKFLKFYRSSRENRLQILIFLGFFLIPFIGMIAFGTYVFLFMI